MIFIHIPSTDMNMDKSELTETLRRIIREEIHNALSEKLTTSKVGDENDVEVYQVKKDGEPHGYIRKKGNVMGGHIGKKAKNPEPKKDSTDEAVYTLEEWMSKLQEAGYNLEELKISKMVYARDARLNRAAAAGEEADKIEKTPEFKVRDRLIRKADVARDTERFNRDRADRTNQYIKDKVKKSDN